MKISRLLVSLLILGTAASSFCNDPPPNLLIIHTDEHNFRTLGCYRALMSDDQAYMWGRGLEVTTPHIDRLAEEGAIYTSYYASSPVCSPSRASLLTGLYPAATDVVRNGIPMNDDVVTFAEMLKRQGYSTSYVGKWHLDGDDKPGISPKRKFGFSDNRYMMNRGHWKQAIERDGEIEVIAAGKMDFSSAGSETYFTDFLTNKTLEILERDKEKPFCVMLSLPDPHGPNRVGPPYDSMYNHLHFNEPGTMNVPGYKRPGWSFGKNQADHLIQKQMQAYFGMVKCIDNNVGRILKFLDDQGLTDNTIVVFTSDHGDLMGEHNKHNKSSPYEASAKVPFVIRYPAKIKAGKQIHTAWTNVDFAPTILCLMGADTLQNTHGIDASSELLIEEKQVNNDRIAYITAAHGDWQAAVSDRYKLVLSNSDSPWLFDLERDPDELVNFYEDKEYRATAKRLELELLTQMHAFEDPSITDWKEIEHSVNVPHPGKNKDFPIEESLTEVQDLDGNIRFYWMNVKSVICGDNKCKVVDVKLYWDPLGSFVRYQLAKGAVLEKTAKGLPFALEDFEKLHDILNIKDSPLSEYRHEELILTEHGSEFVDAHAGATIPLDESTYVKGAIWTCYTLWHYVNGEIIATIRDLTAASYSTDSLAENTSVEAEEMKIFALEHLMKRNAHSSATVSTVVENSLFAERKVRSLILDYLEQTDRELYERSMIKLMKSGSHVSRIAYLNSISTSEHDLGNEFFESLVQDICKLNSYQEISMILDIVQNKAAVITQAVKEALCLLDHPDFLCARRAYWFLMEQELEIYQEKKVTSFMKKHADRL